jgi:hypothetical protein
MTGVVNYVENGNISVRDCKNRDVIIPVDNTINVDKDDVIEYNLDDKGKAFFVRNTFCVESVVITSNPVQEILPVLQNNISFRAYQHQYHIVLAKNSQWGEFIITPINTFGISSNLDVNLAGGARTLPELLRFCNLKSGDKITVSRKLSKLMSADYKYYIKQWPNGR